LKANVVSIRVRADLHAALARGIANLADAERALGRARSVLIKANFNSPHRSPATTDPTLIRALVAVLREHGVTRIQLGDSCGLRWSPAARVHERLGVRPLAAELDVEPIDFDQGPWQSVAGGGTHLPVVRVAAAATTADLVVYACCVKTHPAAGFSMSLKHTIGLLPPEQRRFMHRGHMAEKIAEINMAVRPALVLLDARKCIAAGGPARGWVRRPGRLILGTDRVAADVEALKVLAPLCLFGRLRGSPWDQPQIRQAVARGLGAQGPGAYEFVELSGTG